MNDYKGYIRRMEKSMQEKVFFLEHIDLNSYDLIIDFGCASGDLIERIKGCKDIKTPIVGIERDAYMQKQLSQKGIAWQDSLLKITELENKKVLIIFSSVLHEVEEGFAEIADWLLSVKPTVVARDMMPPTDRFLSFEELNLSLINKEAYEEVWGKIDTVWHLYHYLLKYTYVDNWKTEVLENYFSAPWEWFFNHGIVEYRRDYILKYKKDTVYKDFGYLINEPTHRQLIIRIK